MLTRNIAQSLMGMVPEKVTATVLLLPDSTATSVTVYGAWFKPMDVKYKQYSGINLQGDVTRIKIPDHELNPADNGREIRSNDRITVDSVAYNVISARLMSVRTVWECLVQKEMV